MSSNDEQDAAAQSKKRRIQRACDICRRKKSDGPEMVPGSRCSNCSAYNYECSYVEAAKKRGPPKGYVESMEIRVEKIERLLQTLLPEADIARALSGSSVATWQAPPAADEDELAKLNLIENLQQLSLTSDGDPRFFGRSSGAMLLRTALNIKLDAEPQNAQRHTEFWASRPHSLLNLCHHHNLAASLVDLYFAHINLLLPLLHRPTFARDLAAGLHLTNDGFAATYLLVCAIGARFSPDPRVLLDGNDNVHSCGWRWFQQLQPMRDPLGASPCLYDLQFSALLVIFLHGTSCPHACWTGVSVGIRMAQDVGAHRRKEATHQWTAEDELWKRAFWVLIYLDRTMSNNFGRPCAIQDEDFDLEFPIDCDDEYWPWETSDPTQAFKQPKGKPSLISAFIANLRLCQVLSFALRTIYSINKSKFLLGLSNDNNNDWEHRIVKELDLALNQWIDEMPDHLRWNPSHEHADFFEQSHLLYCTYYQIQILIHRVYLPVIKPTTPLASLKDAAKNNFQAYPSLAICLNAARSISHVADTHRRRVGDKPLPLSQMAVFTAGIVLLLNIWGGKRSGLGLSADSGQEMIEVHRCMRVLRGCEIRWLTAGRLWDILFDLASAGEVPLPATGNATNKRERGAEEPKFATAPHAESGLTTSPTSRPSTRPPDTPLSATSLHTPQPDMFVSSMHPRDESHARTHTQPDTTSSIHNHPLHVSVLPSNNGLGTLSQRLDFSHSRQIIDDSPAGGSWYPNQTRSAHGHRNSPIPLPPHAPPTHNPARIAVPVSAESSFPMSEAFYEHLTASFAPPPARVLYEPHPQLGRDTRGAPAHGVMDPGAMNMWSTTPAGFEMDDWNSYLDTLQRMHPGSDGTT
ncbi:fungal-specific transcription factor domain-containing protein [Mycena albidolilacea]|uniref:Fungal-specific transcription factor domain-containing protein n=1 Tax=Mycena albidolilacea TaxID=1033008 RepID=A0AAD7EM39_9AGAR|nr:fungal-specific transcription factor domain-containing protein [Mycena albidolilacea]